MHVRWASQSPPPSPSTTLSFGLRLVLPGVDPRRASRRAGCSTARLVDWLLAGATGIHYGLYDGQSRQKLFVRPQQSADAEATDDDDDDDGNESAGEFERGTLAPHHAAHRLSLLANLLRPRRCAQRRRRRRRRRPPPRAELSARANQSARPDLREEYLFAGGPARSLARRLRPEARESNGRKNLAASAEAVVVAVAVGGLMQASHALGWPRQMARGQ